MSNQTLPPPNGSKDPKQSRNAKGGQLLKESSNSRAAKARAVRQRQTARVEERRDGKPLIFGWGKHLSRREKIIWQERMAWGSMAVVLLLVGGVLFWDWYQTNVLAPATPVATVNGHDIRTDTFKKVRSVKGPYLHFQIAQLQKQAAAEPPQKPGAIPNPGSPSYQIQQLQAQESPQQIPQETLDDLVNDQLITTGMKTAIRNGADPKSLEANATLPVFFTAFKDFEASGYKTLLASNKLTDEDVKAALAIYLRHNLFETYLQNQMKPRQKQVEIRKIEVASQSSADDILKQLKASGDIHGSLPLAKGLNDSFSKLAKKFSTDANKDKGGEAGFYPQGELDPAIEVQAFKLGVGELSPVISNNGTFVILQVEKIEDNRPVDPALLASLKPGALNHWLDIEKLTAKIKQYPERIIDTSTPDTGQPGQSIPIQPGQSLPVQPPNQ